MEAEAIDTVTEVVAESDPKIVTVVLSIAAVIGGALGATYVIKKIRTRKTAKADVAEATESIEPA